MVDAAWNVTTRYIVGVAIAITILIIALYAAPLMLITIVAGIIAYLISPIIKFLHENLRLPRILAVLIVNLMTAILLLLSPLILVPFARDIVDSLRVMDNAIEYESLTEVLGVGQPYSGTSTTAEGDFRPDDHTQLDKDAAAILAGKAISLLIAVLPDLIGQGATIFLVFFYLVSSSIYFSLDGAKWRRQLPQLAPSACRDEIDILLDRLSTVWTSFLRGQLTVMVIIGLAVWVVLSILGVHGAPSLGLLAGLLEVIPNLGPVLATIPAVLIAFISGSSTIPINNVVLSLAVLAFYIVLQQAETYLITPRIMGKAVRIYPLFITAAVLLALPIAGLLGAFLAVPIVASSREIGSYLLAKVRGVPPYPELLT